MIKKIFALFRKPAPEEPGTVASTPADVWKEAMSNWQSPTTPASAAESREKAIAVMRKDNPFMDDHVAGVFVDSEKAVIEEMTREKIAQFQQRVFAHAAMSDDQTAEWLENERSLKQSLVDEINSIDWED